MGTSSSVDLKFLFNSPDAAIEGVRSHEFDLAVIEHCSEMELSDFNICPLPDDELAFVSSPALGLPAPNLDLDTLLNNRILARKDSCSSRQMVCAGLAGLGKQLDDFNGVVISDDLHLTCQTVVSGGGISFMSKDMVKEYLDSGQMVAHNVKGFTRKRSRSVIFHKNRSNEAVLQNFINCIFSVMDCPLPFA